MFCMILIIGGETDGYKVVIIDTGIGAIGGTWTGVIGGAWIEAMIAEWI